MFDAALRPYLDRVVDPVGRWFAARGISASMVTVVGFALGLAAVLAVVMGMMLAAFVLILLNRLCDGLDGAIARATAPTDFGGFLDIVFDFIFYAMIPFGFALYNPANSLAACFLIVSFFGTAVSFLAFAVMAQSRGLSSRDRGVKSLYYLGGLTEGGETIILLLAMTVTPQWFVYYAYVFGALCWVTSASRILEAGKLLR
jgi:phosphatidylglycerophosphate synthase